MQKAGCTYKKIVFRLLGCFRNWPLCETKFFPIFLPRREKNSFSDTGETAEGPRPCVPATHGRGRETFLLLLFSVLVLFYCPLIARKW